MQSRSASHRPGDDRFGLGDFGRHGVDGVRVDARRQHAAAAIDDVAALGRRLERPRLLLVGARHEIGAAVDLQVDEPRFDAGRPQHEHARRDRGAALQRGAPIVAAGGVI